MSARSKLAAEVSGELIEELACVEAEGPLQLDDASGRDRRIALLTTL